MTELLKKLHIYIGLLSFSNLMVFGIAGLAATFLGGPNRKFVSEGARYESFTPPPGSSDKQIGDAVYERFRFPLTEPPPSWAIRRDAAGNLLFDFYTINGVHKLSYLPREGRLRIENIRNNVWFFLDDAHTMTDIKQADWRVRLWAWYNRFAIWSLIAMAITGTYLWLASRPRYRVAQYSFAGGAGAFILLYALTR